MKEERNREKQRNPGVILGILFRFSAFLYALLSKSLAAGIVHAVAAAGEKRAVREVGSRWHRMLKNARRTVSRWIETCLTLGLFCRAASFFRHCKLRVYAMFFLASGLFTGLVTLVKRFSVPDGSLSYVQAVFAVALCALSIPLFLSDKALGDTLGESVIFRVLLFDAMGFSARDTECSGSAVGRQNVAFLSGMVCGAATYFLSPLLLLIGAFGVAAAWFAILSPEFMLIAICFGLPFLVLLPHPSLILAAAVLWTAFSLILKLIQGKRTLRFEKLDLLVLLFLVTELTGGLVTAGSGASLYSAMIYACFILGYFLTVALMRTRKWLSRAVEALLASATLVSLFGIYQYVSGNVQTTWLDTEMFSEIEGRAVSTFENPNMLALYLIMLFPLALVSMFSAKTTSSFFLRAIPVVSMMGCIVVTWARGGWLGLLFAVAVFFLMFSHKMLGWVLLGCCGLPLLPVILPSSIWNRFSSIGNLADSSTSYRVSIWRGSLSMLKKIWFSGIGVGESAFSQVYPQYALAAIEKAPHSHNLYLQILIELGIGGLVLFLLLLAVFAASSLNFMSYTYDRTVKLFSGAAFCGILAALVQGMTDYIWYNYRVFFVFWIVMGLSVAFRRCGQETEEHDSYKRLPGYDRI